MKTIIPTLLLNLLWCSCKEPVSSFYKRVHIAVVRDVTDRISVMPDADAILQLYGFRTDKTIEAKFRISTLTDRQINPYKDEFLPANNITEADNTLEDPTFRDKLIVAFYERVRKAVATYTATNTKSSLNNSECFRTVAGQLRQLTSETGPVKKLLIYSDLLENSDLFNCYKPASKRELHSNPQHVLELFERTDLLPEDLTDIQIYFIYAPTSREEDKVYVDIVGVYKELLESRGAHVLIQPTGEFQNY